MEPHPKILAGGCACGQLRFRTRDEPDRVGLCHCMTCRKASGSVFNAFAIYPADRVTVEGRYEAWASSTEESRCFCPTCGSHVFALSGSEIEIGLGAFDEPNLFRPTYEAWVPRREHWLRTDDLAAYEKNRGGGAPSPVG
jgi:hypothetical protein